MITHFVPTLNLISGDVMDILALINSAVNFILYCAMSRAFRDTFFRLFCTNQCAQAIIKHVRSLRRPWSTCCCPAQDATPTPTPTSSMCHLLGRCCAWRRRGGGGGGSAGRNPRHGEPTSVLVTGPGDHSNNVVTINMTTLATDEGAGINAV